MSSTMTRAAFEQAKAVGHGWVGPDHYLLALLAQPSVATEVLKSVGVTYQAVFNRYQRLSGLGGESPTIRRPTVHASLGHACPLSGVTVG